MTVVSVDAQKDYHIKSDDSDWSPAQPTAPMRNTPPPRARQTQPPPRRRTTPRYRQPGQQPHISLSSHGLRPIIRLIFIGVEIIFIFFLFLNLTVILNLKKLSFDSFLKFANKLQQQPLRLQPPLLQAKVSFLIWQQLLGIFNFRFV